MHMVKVPEMDLKSSSGPSESFGLPPGFPGLMGGGGATNVLTEQAKVRSVGAVLGDVFNIFKRKEIDPQTILFDEGDLYQDNRVMMSPSQQGPKRNMSISQNQIQRTPIGPPTKPKPQVEFLPLGSGGGNVDASIPPTENQIPQFSASTAGSSRKLQTLGIG